MRVLVVGDHFRPAQESIIRLIQENGAEILFTGSSDAASNGLEYDSIVWEDLPLPIDEEET
jgi:hypothetical protein